MNPNPLSTNSKPMHFKDAAIVATVLTLALLASVFYPAHNYDVFRADPWRFLWDFCVFCFGAWITEFGALTGLMAYTKYTSPSDTKESA
jgi:hypothetical protein